MARRKFFSLRAASRRMKSEDKDRRARLRRIQEKEKELILLRALPAQDYFRLGQIRSETAVKTIQRSWRRRSPTGGSAVSSSGAAKAHASDPMAKERLALEELLMSAAKSAALHKPEDKAFKVEVDALGLAQLQRRIQDAARRRVKEGKDDRGNIFQRQGLPFGQDADDLGGSIDLGRTASKAKRGREKVEMQRLMELQQTAAVWLGEYGDSRYQLMAEQAQRLKSLGHCKSLVQQLSQLPSLDEAKAMLKSQAKDPHGPADVKAWLADEALSRPAIEYSVAAHLRTLHAVTHR